MYPGSLPLIFNGSVPGHEKLLNVRRCSIWQVPLHIYVLNIYVHFHPLDFLLSVN